MLLCILAEIPHSHGKFQPKMCAPFILFYCSPYFSYIHCLLTFRSWLVQLPSEIIMDVSHKLVNSFHDYSWLFLENTLTGSCSNTTSERDKAE